MLLVMHSSPTIIEGGCHVDARGRISFVNGFTFEGVERFYWVQSAELGMQRGWVGHQREHKWFTAIVGEVQIAVVKPDHWATPSTDLPVSHFLLSASQPQVLYVPPGHATGSTNLCPDAILMVFSSGKIADAPTDDFRFPVSYWPLEKE